MWDIAKLDPQWAWAPYEPDQERPWDSRAAAHLFRRAGLGATPALLDEAVAGGPQEVVDRLVSPNDESDAFESDMDRMARQLVAGGEVRNLSAWWLYRLLYTPDPLLERITIFWHGHFATGADKVTDPDLMYEQNLLLRKHALGDFGQLAHDISRDPAMLIYLDSVTNRKAHPNENYARELMELFCLGEGNYSEKDIQELARCFTGWEVKRKKYRFNRFQHDTGRKHILGRAGDFSGDDGVDVVLAQEAAPRFIATKLVNYLVFDEPVAPPALIEPLARTFRENELNVGSLVRRIIGSNLFFHAEAYARKIRSPVDLAVALLRSLKGTTDMHVLARELDKLGQVLFYPPNVKGWDGGRAWINSSTLLGRANMLQAVLGNERTRFSGGKVADGLEALGWESSEAIVDGLAATLLAIPLDGSIRRELIRVAESNVDELLPVWGALPEMQLA